MPAVRVRLVQKNSIIRGYTYMLQKRDTWVDAVKIYACILVLLGHLFQGLVAADIISAGPLYKWFNETIYYFHVPLFFICSGFLHQKYSTVRNISGWRDSFLKKLVSFSVPYFVFSMATYALKVVFSGSVNKEVDGLLETLFLKPLSPYWYLYILIIIFFFAFTFKSKKEIFIVLAVVVSLRVISYIPGFDIYLLKAFFENAVWFVLGMVLCFFDLPRLLKKIKTVWAFVGVAVFALLSIVFYDEKSYYGTLPFAMGLLGCFATILFIIKFEKYLTGNQAVSIMTKYTFPVFLMHTIFAAGFRGVLVKVGVTNAVVHIVCGITVSIICPTVVAFVMSKMKWPEFLLYPNKFIKVGKRKGETTK